MRLRPVVAPLAAALLLHAPLALAQQPAPAPAAAQPDTKVPGAKPVEGLPNVLGLGVPEVPASLRARMNQYLNSRAAGVLDVTPDGKALLVSTRFGNTNQVHLVEMPMGARQQLTFADEPIAGARFQPGNPDVLFYRQDVGGGEFFQVYRLDRRTGKSELLTDGKSRHEGLVLSDDGKWLAYGGTGRNGKDTDVYVAPVADPKAARRVTELEGSWSPVEFSRDGKRLLAVQFRSAEDSDLHVVDLATGERRMLTPDPAKHGKGSVAGAAFTADGKGVYLVTDRYSDFRELYRIELDKAPYVTAPKSLTASVRWNVEDVELSPDGRTLAVVTNEDGYSKLRLLDVGTGRLTPVPLPTGQVGGVTFPLRRNDVLAFSAMTARDPADAYTLDLRTRKVTRWTKSEVGGLDTSTFVEPQLVRYPSTDGVQVPAFLYKPRGKAGERAPVVVVWHGGPEGQSVPTFNPFVQFMATEMGIAVLTPNVRGSDGYGKAFLNADNGVKREASLKDIGATLDFIAKQPELDAGRVGVYGGSYGGYMVLASAAFYPERVRAAVDVVGISSLPTFLQNTQAYRRDLRRAEYGDERVADVRAVQERISPLNHVKAIKAALYVQQGKNDPRVPQSEAEQIVQAVRQGGRDVWYGLALDEGHGFQKKPTRDWMSLTTLMFFDKHLAPPKPISAPATR